jgi:hypothetical protein
MKQTPKEKAKEIIDKHYWLFGDGYLGHQHIQHALLEIDEIIKQSTDNEYCERYFKEVKQEIEKL